MHYNAPSVLIMRINLILPNPFQSITLILLPFLIPLSTQTILLLIISTYLLYRTMATNKSELVMGLGFQFTTLVSIHSLLIFNFHLQNLLHVPTFTKYLISVLQFCVDNSCFFEFHATWFVVKHKMIGKLLTSGPTHNGLYFFPFSTPSSSPSMNLGERANLSCCYQRVDHHSLEIVFKVLHTNYFSYFSNPIFVCP